MPRSLVVLGAFPSVKEAVARIQQYCGPQFWDEPTIQHHWNESRSNVVRPPSYENGLPRLQDIPQAFTEYAINAARTSFLSQLDQGQWSIRMVEIDPLLSQAIFVNLDYIQTILSEISASSQEDAFRICLPITPREHAIQIGLNEISLFTSDRSIGWVNQGALVNVNQGVTVAGFPLLIGNGPVHVKCFHGKYVLVDGYHRAIALRKLGFEFMPCIITDANTPQDIATMLPESFNISFLMENVFPPTIGGFLSNAAKEVVTRQSGKLIKIKIEETHIILPY